ncbi:nitrate reductase cytochrome c-type subunit [Helicobacter sp. 11S03491-1]|uniref:nitrate reductase cytochrome c-type subunit n=1 Tax=Helicobacter sp. 11S03491-1 TaxID=1476196 RepID=UPI000BA56656|nr:nitrate reductase cytochrome c-type subunit [Helicobacter sp. 11S03491-1]PAF41118.1 nitrate reductase [Helicobacter sp. 11S03491-1]
MKFKILGLIVVAGLMVACSSDTQEEVNEVSAQDLGLRKAPVSDEKDVSLSDYQYSTSPAGESQKIERSYENAPPLIPHDTEGMLDITQDNNMCLGCHAPDVAQSVGATPVPKSHTYDLRNHHAIKDGIAQSRYNCTQCHVPQANAKPLVKNNFTPVFKSERAKSRSNLLDVINEGVK